MLIRRRTALMLVTLLGVCFPMAESVHAVEKSKTKPAVQKNANKQVAKKVTPASAAKKSKSSSVAKKSKSKGAAVAEKAAVRPALASSAAQWQDSGRLGCSGWVSQSECANYYFVR